MKDLINISWIILMLSHLSCWSNEKKHSNSNVKINEKIASVHITGSDKMQYNIKHFEVPAGYTIIVKLTNTGSLPKQAMAHNFIILKQGIKPMDFINASLQSKSNDYFPESYKDNVIAATKLLGPGESDRIKFTAPPPGKYVFLCSFPAHYQTGMTGTMHVK